MIVIELKDGSNRSFSKDYELIEKSPLLVIMKDNKWIAAYTLDNIKSIETILVEPSSLCNELEEMIDEIECTDWYHINQLGELVHGANSKGNGTEPLYKAEDILKICNAYRQKNDEYDNEVLNMAYEPSEEKPENIKIWFETHI